MIEKETTVGMPPGIGDLHWIMTKFESFKERHNIKKVKNNHTYDHRIQQIFDEVGL